MSKKNTLMYVTLSGSSLLPRAELGLYSEKSKRKLKRNNNQRNMSYGWQHRVFPNGDISVRGNVVADSMKPLFIENTPQVGFKILGFKIVGRSNKVWRIYDPRGFEVEVTTKAMMKTIESCSIEEGTITSWCVWDFGKDGCSLPALVKQSS